MADTAASLDREAALLNDDRRRLEEAARIRSDNDLSTIARLRDEHDDVRRHVWDRNQEIASLQDQIDRMRAINAEKDNELSLLTADLRARDDSNAALRSEIADLDARLAAERDAGRALKADIDRTALQLNDTDRHNTDLADRIRQAETDLAHSRARERELNDHINVRQAEINRKNDDLAAGQAELERLRASIAKAEADLAALQHGFDDKVGATNLIKRDRDAERARHVDLTNRLRDLETCI